MILLLLAIDLCSTVVDCFGQQLLLHVFKIDWFQHRQRNWYISSCNMRIAKNQGKFFGITKFSVCNLRKSIKH